MSDPETTGNLVNWGLRLLSGAIWLALFVRLARGRPILNHVPREPCPWPGWAIAIAFPVSIAVQFVVVKSIPQGKTPSLLTVQSACVINVAEICVLMGMLALGAPIRAADFGLRRVTAPREIAVGLLGMLAAWLPVSTIYYVVNSFGLREDGARHSFFKILENSPGGITVAWIVIAAVVLAPLAEELLYRVIIQGWLETRLPPRTAILFVSILFASVHFEIGRPDSLPLFPLAVVLGYVYYRSHSLLAVAVLHAAFNAANLGLALLSLSQA